MTVRPFPTGAGDLDEPQLSEVLGGCWTLLEEGVRNRDHGFHLPAVATVAPDGRPGLRTVVLRGCDRETRRLRFHTHRRSPKLGHLAGEPRAALLFYDRAELTQLRVDVRCELHLDDEEADTAWRATGPFSRRTYLQQVAPSHPVPAATSSLPTHLAGRAPGPEESEAGRAAFAVVTCRIESLDWFYLCAAGHRRARFDWTEAGELAAGWLAP